jgi:hypothetical protein
MKSLSICFEFIVHTLIDLQTVETSFDNLSTDIHGNSFVSSNVWENISGTYSAASGRQRFLPPQMYKGGLSHGWVKR